jgi:hypothetical protein
LECLWWTLAGLVKVELVICNGRQSVSLSKHEQSQAKWHIIERFDDDDVKVRYKGSHESRSKYVCSWKELGKVDKGLKCYHRLFECLRRMHMSLYPPLTFPLRLHR